MIDEQDFVPALARAAPISARETACEHARAYGKFRATIAARAITPAPYAASCARYPRACPAHVLAPSSSR
jgi:hypothetical protein